MNHELKDLKLFDFPIDTPPELEPDKPVEPKTVIRPWYQAGTKMSGTQSTDVSIALIEAGLYNVKYEVMPAHDEMGFCVEGVNLIICSATQSALPRVAVGSRFKSAQPENIFSFVSTLLDQFHIDVIGHTEDYARLWMRLETSTLWMNEEAFMRSMIIVFDYRDNEYIFVPAITHESSLSEVGHRITTKSGRAPLIRIKYRKANPKSIELALNKVRQHWDDMFSSFKRMQSHQVDDEDIDAFIWTLTKNKSKTAKAPLQTKKRREMFHHALNGNTAWDLYLMVAQYVGWERLMRGDVKDGVRWYTSAIDGAGAKFREKAASLAMKLCRQK